MSQQLPPLDEKNPVRWSIASLLRILVPVLIAYLGVEVADSQVEQIVAALSFLLWTAFSLYTSVAQRQKLRDAHPGG